MHEAKSRVENTKYFRSEFYNYYNNNLLLCFNLYLLYTRQNFLMPILQICSDAKKVLFASQINTGLSKSIIAEKQFKGSLKKESTLQIRNTTNAKATRLNSPEFLRSDESLG